MTSQQLYQLRNDMNAHIYDPSAVARRYCLSFAKESEQGLLGCIATAFMGAGHVELAEEMVRLGANPSLATPDFQWITGAYPSLGHEKVPSIPYLLASWGPDNAARAGSPGSKIASRNKVLGHISSRSDTWNTSVEQKIGGNTALIQALARHNSYSRWARTAKPNLDYLEIFQFQEALIEAGAKVNPQGVDGNLLESILPDYRKDEPTVEDVGMGIDKMIAWGVETTKNTSKAWARAIRQDVDVRYTRKVILGPRVRALLERGIVLDSPSNAIWLDSPLLQAVNLGCLPMVDKLIKQGVDSCWTDPSTGDNLLTFNHDPKGNTIEALRRFPKGAFDNIVNKPANNGETALHRATNSLNAPMVQFLLENGADIDALNGDKQKPLQAMRRSGDKAQAKFDEVLQVMLNHGVDLGADDKSSALHKAAKLLSVKAVQHLLDKGVAPDALDQHKRTPAELAIDGHQANTASFFNPQRGAMQVKVLDCLREAGADLTAPLRSGSTLLHLAARRGSHVVASYLLGQGANPHALDAEGNTPMHMWSDRSFVGHHIKPKNEGAIIEMIEAFIRAGGNTDTLSPTGALAFETARNLPGVQAALEKAMLDMTTAPAQTTPRTGRQRRL